MIREKSFAISLALGVVAIFSGCQEKIVNEVEESKIALKISVPMPETKLTGNMEESTIKNYQVFLYNSDDILEDYVNQDTEDITLKCTEGTKTIIVLANAPAISSGTTLNSLLTMKSLLSDNSQGNFIMSGKVVEEVSTSNADISIPVSRVVSKIRLSTLTPAFEMPQYRSMEFKVLSIYLVNAPADGSFFTSVTPTAWFHKQKYESTNSCSLIYDEVGGAMVSSSTPYQNQHCFYCYPNNTEQDTFEDTWSARHTRLVVEATLGDTKYYYPVTLPELQSNKLYDVNLTVTRPGAVKPDAEIDKFAVEFSITLKDWETGATVTEEI